MSSGGRRTVFEIDENTPSGFAFRVGECSGLRSVTLLRATESSRLAGMVCGEIPQQGSVIARVKHLSSGGLL